MYCTTQADLESTPMDRGAWWATVHGVTKSWMRLSDRACMPDKLAPAVYKRSSPCINFSLELLECPYSMEAGFF